MKRVQRRREPGWKRQPNVVYVGRPSQWANLLPVGLEVACCCAEALGIVSHHPDRGVAAATEGAPELAGRVVVVPDQVGGRPADLAGIDHDGSLAGPVRSLVEPRLLVEPGVSTAPRAGSGARVGAPGDLRGPAGGADGRLSDGIDVGEPVAPASRRRTGGELAATEPLVVAADAEAARPKALAAARRGADPGALGCGRARHVNECTAGPHVLTASQVVRWYRGYAQEQLRLDPTWLAPLVGRDLECWCDLCPAHQGGLPALIGCQECPPCHADVLLALLEQQAIANVRRGPQIVLAADLVDDDGAPAEWNTAGLAEAADRYGYHGESDRG